MARCPECDATFGLKEEDLEEGESIDCPECGVVMEVAGIHPLHLDLVHGDMDGEWD